MVYESDFYTTRRPYTRSAPTHYTTMQSNATTQASPLLQQQQVQKLPHHLPYIAHKRLTSTIYARYPVVNTITLTIPIRVHSYVRPSIIAAEKQRIKNQSRPSSVSYVTRYLNSKDNILFDDEAREIRARADSLLRRIHVFVPRPTSRDFVEDIVPERMRSDDYIRRILTARKNAKRNDDEPTNWYESPEHRQFGSGHLAGVTYTGGKAYPRRRPFYKVADLRSADVQNDVNLLSYYAKNRQAAASAYNDSDVSPTETDTQKSRILEEELVNKISNKEFAEERKSPKIKSKRKIETNDKPQDIPLFHPKTECPIENNKIDSERLTISDIKSVPEPNDLTESVCQITTDKSMVEHTNKSIRKKDSDVLINGHFVPEEDISEIKCAETNETPAIVDAADDNNKAEDKIPETKLAEAEESPINAEVVDDNLETEEKIAETEVTEVTEDTAIVDIIKSEPEEHEHKEHVDVHEHEEHVDIHEHEEHVDVHENVNGEKIDNEVVENLNEETECCNGDNGELQVEEDEDDVLQRKLDEEQLRRQVEELKRQAKERERKQKEEARLAEERWKAEIEEKVRLEEEARQMRLKEIEDQERIESIRKTEEAKEIAKRLHDEKLAEEERRAEEYEALLENEQKEREMIEKVAEEVRKRKEYEEKLVSDMEQDAADDEFVPESNISDCHCHDVVKSQENEERPDSPDAEDDTQVEEEGGCISIDTELDQPYDGEDECFEHA